MAEWLSVSDWKLVFGFTCSTRAPVILTSGRDSVQVLHRRQSIEPAAAQMGHTDTEHAKVRQL